MRSRHKIARPHLKATRYLRVQRKLCRIGAVFLGVWTSGHAVRYLGLHHHNSTLDARHRLEGPQNHRGGDLVRQVGHKLVRLFPRRLRQLGRAHLERIALHQGELLAVARAGLGQNGWREHGNGERSYSGADLVHHVVAVQLGKLEDATDDVVVYEEVLAKSVLEGKPMLLEHGAGLACVCKV